MATADNISGIVNVAIGALPSIIALIKEMHGTQAPAGTPPPTDADVIAALQTAVASTVAKDDAWKAEHPESVQLPNGPHGPGPA